MKHPLVSVIVPNYNHAKYLDQRIESILNQTYQDFELIILDDKSTDNSLEVLEKYKNHPKVSHFVVNEENSGSTFIQWKKGIELANGDYIWIAESDDWADLNFLDKLMSRFFYDHSLSLVYCDSRIICDGNVVGLFSLDKNIKFSTKRWSGDYFNIGISELNDYMTCYDAIVNNASSAVFKRCDIYPFLNCISSYRYAGDLFSYIALASNGNISFISEAMSNYRSHEHNVTKKSWLGGEQILEVYNVYSCFLDKLRLSSKIMVSKSIAERNFSHDNCWGNIFAIKKRNIIYFMWLFFSIKMRLMSFFNY